MGDLAGGGHEIVVGVFGIDAAFDRPALLLHLLLGVAQRPAAGDADLLVDDVDAGDHLGHRVLHLQAGVHLQEVEVAVLIHQELDRPGVDVAHRLGGPHATLAHPLAQLLVFVDERRGRFLQELLVPALQRALALAQVDDIAVLVGQDLELDVPRAFEQLFEVDVAIAKGGLGFAAGGMQQARASLPGCAPRACLCRRRRRWL